MNSSKWRINIIVMEIIKLLRDYAKTPLEDQLDDYFTQSFESSICREPIKNKEFMIKYIMPVNDFIVHTTALPCCDARRMLY